MKRLENKVAVVTGVGSGIGKAIANAFADEGASLGIGDINEDLLSKTTDSLKTKTELCLLKLMFLVKIRLKN